MGGFWGPQGAFRSSYEVHVIYQWKASWSAEADAGKCLYGIATSQVSIGLYANMKEVGSGWVLGNDASCTVTNLQSNCARIPIIQSAAGATYTISFPGCFYAGQVCEFYSYMTTYTTATGSLADWGGATVNIGSGGNQAQLVYDNAVITGTC